MTDTSPPRPTRLVDVAALAGVSPSTASKALNDTGSLTTETRDRVREAAEKLGFVPHAGAQSMHGGRTFTVGLLSSDTVGRFSLPVVLGAENALLAGQISALLATARHDPIREQHHIRSLISRRVDGIIVTGRTAEPRESIGTSVPVVYAFAPSAVDGDTSVVGDDWNGMAQVVDHLRSIGRRRLTFVGGRGDQFSSRIRHEATLAAAETHGLSMVGGPQHGEWSERWGRHAVDALIGDGLLQAGDPDSVDAVVFASDQLARGGTDRLRELGLEVPGDVAVTGYDDWQVMSLASRPPLTTVDMELEEIGRRSVELLLQAVDGESSPGVHQVRPRLVPRESTLGR
ncbi:LacI family DNA-binding transcriptional regulator [Nesterenkonia halophila]|uniref:LacI family DNA-binding transcriptional regulator n=1 Tax=Nesterenkonia halophila TaxID=302044 RepID=UPI0012926F94|nr:LacI family DNA-binding transcriptional regulator [Nesterenkonia halophila]